MSEKEFIQKLIESASLAAPPDDFTLSSRLTDIKGWDSLATVGVILMMDLEFNRKVSIAEVTACKTIHDIYILAGCV